MEVQARQGNFLARPAEAQFDTTFVRLDRVDALDEPEDQDNGAENKENATVETPGYDASQPILSPPEDFFQIGRKNLILLRKLFWKNGFLITAEDVEGTDSRTMFLDIASGEVMLRVGGSERLL